MGIDRKIFKASFKQDELTNWNCPTCGKGFLKVNKSTFRHEETRDSVGRRDLGDEWYPEWIEYVYSCLMECNNPDCKEIVSSLGVGSTGELICGEDIPHPSYEDCFIPKFFSPPLNIFDYQDSIPEEVKGELKKSFTLFFCDPDSSANHIRIALEHLLTHMDIEDHVIKNGEEHYMSLHCRIQKLPEEYEDIKKIFEAIKWLGNAGSHSSKSVSTDDALDAYDLMEHLLVKVFGDESKEMQELAENINKNKGPA